MYNRTYKPKLTKALRDLQAKYYDIIKEIKIDNGVLLIFKSNYSTMDNESFIHGPTAQDIIRRFKFKRKDFK